MPKKIDLSLTPEEALGSEIIRGPEDFQRLQDKAQGQANLSYPFIDVWSFQAALSFMAFDSTGSTCSPERLTEEELEDLGITEEMLLEAIEEAGGAINRSGHYPISEAIREKLAQVIPQEV